MTVLGTSPGNSLVTRPPILGLVASSVNNESWDTVGDDFSSEDDGSSERQLVRVSCALVVVVCLCVALRAHICLTRLGIGLCHFPTSLMMDLLRYPSCNSSAPHPCGKRLVTLHELGDRLETNSFFRWHACLHGHGWYADDHDVGYKTEQQATSLPTGQST